jgi:hypothetical protein
VTADLKCGKPMARPGRPGVVIVTDEHVCGRDGGHAGHHRSLIWLLREGLVRSPVTVADLTAGSAPGEAAGDLAVRLVPIATETALLVRDAGRDGIATWLRVLHPGLYPALAVVLAGMVPVDSMYVTDMLAWVNWDERFTPPKRGDLAENLVPVAVDLAFAVRDRDKDRIGTLFTAINPALFPGLVIVLAAMVPAQLVTPESLLAWVDQGGVPLSPVCEPAA